MSNPGEADPTPIHSVRQLADWFAEGSKPRQDWRIGTEHEKFGFRRDDLRPPTYDEHPGGIRAILEGLAARGWEPILDRGNPIGLVKDNASVSLEPGGQTELSGAPLADLHATAAELDSHLSELREVAGPLGTAFLPVGFHPLAARDAMPWMPKQRYAIMRQYMPRVGELGLDMMLRTCTVQSNLDFGDEADMVEKLRLSLALQPLSTALWANSPFREGRATDYLTLRGEVWTRTDPDRTGIPSVVFEEGFGFERFAEYVLDVPMYFVMREGAFVDATSTSFRDFIRHGLPGHPDVHATMGDWADHVTTVFTDVRLKRFLEMRGADVGSPAMIVAHPAFWTGLLYDDAAQKAGLELVRGWSVGEMRRLRTEVPKLGLRAEIGGRPLRDVARDVVRIARDGLAARGLGEEKFLAPVEEIAETGQTQADRWLAHARGPWHGDVSRIFAEGAV